MGNQMLISILMPIYKVEHYLEKTLDSIFSQTYQNLYFVFVNDCSPDNSLQVLKDSIVKHGVSPDRYTIINHEQNLGIAVSRADSIANAKGDYIYFVDSDDWIEKEAVEQMVYATKKGTVDIVGCDYMKDFQSGEITYHYENYGETCIDNLIKCLNYDIATVLWKLLIKRSLFDNFKISPINIGEDYIISVKLFYYAHSFVALHKSFYHYVQYNQNRLSFQSHRSLNDHVKCVEEVENFIQEKGLYDAVARNKINLRKFNIKSNFVLNKHLLDSRAYKETFPEVIGVWKQMPYSKKEKVKFWLAEHGLFFLLNLL